MVEKPEWPGMLSRQVKLPRDVSSGQGWADLACALQDLKEKNSRAAAGRWRRPREQEQEQEGPVDATAATATAEALHTPPPHQPGMSDHLGSGDLSLQLGSSASYSTTSASSSSNSRASGADHYYDANPNQDRLSTPNPNPDRLPTPNPNHDRLSTPPNPNHDWLSTTPNLLSPEDLSFLQDGEVRSMFKKITVNATLLNHAIDRLGGGGQGMKALLGYIRLWVKTKNNNNNNNTHSSISHCMATLESLQAPPPAAAEIPHTPVSAAAAAAETPHTSAAAEILHIPAAAETLETSTAAEILHIPTAAETLHTPAAAEILHIPPAAAETLHKSAVEILQAPVAFRALSAAVLDYKVSPHPAGHRQTTPTPPPVLWMEHVADTRRGEANSSSSRNGLKRLSQPFEPLLLHQFPGGGGGTAAAAAHLHHHSSKVSRIYGGSFADTTTTAADMNAHGFSSSREAAAATAAAAVGSNLSVLIHHNNNNNMVAVNQQPLSVVSSLQKGLGFGLDADAADNNSSSCLSPAASKRAARKIRMAQQRRSSSSSSIVSCSVSQGATTTILSSSSSGCCGSSCTAAGVTLPGTGVLSDGTLQGNSQIQPMRMPVRNKGQAWKAESLHLLVQKDLRPSDVGNLGRIILPKKESEVHLPSLTLKEGVFIAMEDFDTRMTWRFRYRYWPNNRSRMYLLENTGEFVKVHDLEEGDLLFIYKSRQGNFVIRGKKKSCSKACAPTTTTTTPTADFHLANNVTHSLARVPSDKGIIVKAEEESEVHDGKSLAHVNVPLEDCGYCKLSEPFDIFLQDVMQGIQNEYKQCGEVLQQLERFPSLDPDVCVDGILGLTFAGAGCGGGSVSSTVIPKIEPASCPHEKGWEKTGKSGETGK